MDMEGVDSKVMAFSDGKDARLLAAAVADFILEAKLASSTCFNQISREHVLGSNPNTYVKSHFPDPSEVPDQVHVQHV